MQSSPAKPPPAEAPGPPRLGQKVLGFRRWRLEGYMLRPIATHLPAHWQLGPNTAECLRSYVFGSGSGIQAHPAPDPNCHCGLYAFHEPSQGQPAGDTVSGAVLAWGRIEVHTNGFRAEHAEPVVLAYCRGQTPEHIRALRSIAAEFYLPVVEHGELAAAAAHLGKPVPAELCPVEPVRAFEPSPVRLAPRRLALADELLLAALFLDNDGWALDCAGRPRLPGDMGLVVAGAELAELVALGLVEREGDRISAVHPGSPADPDLSAALGNVAGLRGRRIDASLMNELAQDDPAERRLRRLHAAGRVHEYEQPGRGLLGKKTVRRWFVREDGAHGLGLDRWQAALNGGSADERTATLLALVYASGMHRRWLRGTSRVKLGRRMRAMGYDRCIDRAVSRAMGMNYAMSVACNGSL